MKKFTLLFFIVASLIVTVNTASAGIVFSDGFETGWSGDYAPGWQNGTYAHGDPPIARMDQTTTYVYAGSYALKLSVTAAGYPVSSTNWWGLVNPTGISHDAILKEYDPYVSAYFYDEVPEGNNPGGFLSAVPSPVVADDWTDLQHGCRWGKSTYWYGWGTSGGYEYRDTSIVRSIGWHNFKMQLSSSTGKINYYIDSNLVGSSDRNDYTDLADVGLGVWFDDGDFLHSSVYWDNFEVASTIPEPGTIMLLGSLATGLFGFAGLRRRFTK